MSAMIAGVSTTHAQYHTRLLILGCSLTFVVLVAYIVLYVHARISALRAIKKNTQEALSWLRSHLDGVSELTLEHALQCDYPYRSIKTWMRLADTYDSVVVYEALCVAVENKSLDLSLYLADYGALPPKREVTIDAYEVADVTEYALKRLVSLGVATPKAFRRAVRVAQRSTSAEILH